MSGHVLLEEILSTKDGSLDEMRRAMRSLISAHKLVLVYAQSGAGKTSIFNAHLFIH